MKTKLLLIIYSICAAGLHGVKAEAPAGPVPSQLEVIATNGAGVEKHLVSQAGFAGQLVIKPNQAVPVKLQFSSDKNGMPVAITSLDGGDINGDDAVISPVGKALFTFRATAPGLYRVVVQLPTERHRIEFYVLDPNHPRRNPRTAAGK
jgi:hypothetical protein